MAAQVPIHVRPLSEEDREWALRLVEDRWGSRAMVTRGVLYDMAQFPGFVALIGDERTGLLTYRLAGDECEVMSLDSLVEGRGVGSALLGAVREAARAARCRRLWLITTNDNMAALRFYQKRGFRLVALYRGALDVSRCLKPEIPLLGLDGIPLRDEIELDMVL